MIKIFLKKKGNEFVLLKAIGHAGAGIKGKDPICSAFSFLLQSISAFSRTKGIELEVREKNAIEINLVLLKEMSPDLYNYLLNSIALLKLKFSNNFKIIEK